MIIYSITCAAKDNPYYWEYIGRFFSSLENAAKFLEQEREKECSLYIKDKSFNYSIVEDEVDDYE